MDRVFRGRSTANETDAQRQARLDREAIRNYRTGKATSTLYKHQQAAQEDYELSKTRGPIS